MQLDLHFGIQLVDLEGSVYLISYTKSEKSLHIETLHTFTLNRTINNILYANL